MEVLEIDLDEVIWDVAGTVGAEDLHFSHAPFHSFCVCFFNFFFFTCHSFHDICAYDGCILKDLHCDLIMMSRLQALDQPRSAGRRCHHHHWGNGGRVHNPQVQQIDCSSAVAAPFHIQCWCWRRFHWYNITSWEEKRPGEASRCFKICDSLKMKHMEISNNKYRPSFH